MSTTPTQGRDNEGMNENAAGVASRVLSLLDLTELASDCDTAAVVRLCHAAIDPRGNVAAVCVWPEFVGLSAELLASSGVRIATVVNFPEGNDETERVCAEAGRALADGANEIDLVLPWHDFLAGREKRARKMVAAVREAIAATTLKVILETGQYPDQIAVANASRLAVEEGADFLKTSTGKTAVSASLEAATTVLNVIHEADRVVGIKASGGIRSLLQARSYLELADAIMGPDWATPATFRFGASALHDDVMRVLGP